MHGRIRLVLILLLAFGWSGCANRVIKYYTVQTPAVPDRASAMYPISIFVGSVSGPNILRDGPIAYRVGANEIGTYEYHRWAEPPVDMLKMKLTEVLRASGHYESVTGLGSASNANFVLRGRLNDFEEVDGESITGLVSMQLELYDRKTGKVAWSHFYSQSEAVEGKQIAAVVGALNRNLDRGLREVVADLGEYFARNPHSQ